MQTMVSSYAARRRFNEPIISHIHCRILLGVEKKARLTIPRHRCEIFVADRAGKKKRGCRVCATGACCEGRAVAGIAEDFISRRSVYSIGSASSSNMHSFVPSEVFWVHECLVACFKCTPVRMKFFRLMPLLVFPPIARAIKHL